MVNVGNWRVVVNQIASFHVHITVEINLKMDVGVHRDLTANITNHMERDISLAPQSHLTVSLPVTCGVGYRDQSASLHDIGPGVCW